MSPPVLITRAEPGASETAQRLADLPCQPICTPMLHIIARPAPDMDVASAAGFIFTSANGVRALADVTQRRNVPVWCVGPATLAAAQAAGFSICQNANGDGAALAALIEDKAKPSDGPLLHIANDAAAGKLCKRLTIAGFIARFVPLYTASPEKVFTPAARAALEGDVPGIVLVHSAKGAEATASALAGRRLSGWGLCGVSEKALAPLKAHPWNRVDVAVTPNEAALMKALCSGLARI